MKKSLKKVSSELYRYKNGERIDGANPNMGGDCSGLRGDCSWLRGECSGLYGECSGLRGECSGLRGNLDECEITAEDRKKGIDIKDLIS